MSTRAEAWGTESSRVQKASSWWSTSGTTLSISGENHSHFTQLKFQPGSFPVGSESTYILANYTLPANDFTSANWDISHQFVIHTWERQIQGAMSCLLPSKWVSLMWYITSSQQRESSQCYYWWLLAGTNAVPICSSENMHWHCQLNSSLPSSSFCHYISNRLSHIQVKRDQKVLFITLIGTPTCLWGTKGSIRKFFRIPLAFAICRQKTRQTPINKYLPSIHIYDSTRQTSRSNTKISSSQPPLYCVFWGTRLFLVARSWELSCTAFLLSKTRLFGLKGHGHGRYPCSWGHH